MKIKELKNFIEDLDDETEVFVCKLNQFGQEYTKDINLNYTTSISADTAEPSISLFITASYSRKGNKK